MPSIQDLYSKVKPQGVYLNLSIEEYHSDLSLSVSGMKHLLNSDLHYWYNSGFNPNREFIETPALKTGKLLHTMLLEPEKFHQLYKIKNNVYSSKASGFIGEGEYNEALNMINIIKENPFYEQFLSWGFPEVSIFWRCSHTGVPCKIRIDYLNKYIVDYKTTRNALLHKIKPSILAYNYHIQAAFYIYGLQQIASKDYKIYNIENKEEKKDLKNIIDNFNKKFVFLWQEKTPPHASIVTELTSDFIEVGAEGATMALDLYKKNFEKFGFNKWHDPENDKIYTIDYDY